MARNDGAIQLARTGKIPKAVELERMAHDLMRKLHDDEIATPLEQAKVMASVSTTLTHSRSSPASTISDDVCCAYPCGCASAKPSPRLSPTTPKRRRASKCICGKSKSKSSTPLRERRCSTRW